MQHLDPKHIAAFTAVVRAGTLRAAAEQLGVEASTISRSLAALEKQLGTALMERGRAGSQLTEAGQILQAHLRQQEGALDLMQSQFDALRNMQRGTIHLAVGEGFVGDLFSGALNSFAQSYPKLTYDLTVGATDHIAHLVKADQAHLGLAYNVDPDQQLKTLAQAASPLVMLAASASPFADTPAPIALATAAALPCARLNRGSGVGAMLREAETRHGLRLNAVVKTASIATLKAFVRSGMGVTFLPRFVMREEIDAGLIIEHPLRGAGFGTGHAHLIARSGRQLPNAAQLLARHLAKSMSAFAS